MAVDDEFEEIARANPELRDLGAVAPDGFMVLLGVDGSTVRVSRLSFMEHTNAIADVLKDPAGDLEGVMGPVAGLPPLARRVVLATAYEHFKDWLLDRCPVGALPFAIVHVPLFVALYRELTKGAPEYAHEFTLEGVEDE